MAGYFYNPLDGNFDATLAFLRFCVYDEDLDSLKRKI